MDIHIVPNILALVLSLIAAIVLVQFAAKMRGGQLAIVINLIVAGITLSVTLHAAAEMAEIYGLLPEGILFKIMGTLLSLGSALFIVAAFKARSIFTK